MIMSRQQFDLIKTTGSKVIVVDEKWCNNSYNKNSSSKWKKLAIDLFKNGYSIRIKESGSSKYLTVAGKNKVLKIRISNHPPTIPKDLKKFRYWNKRFGNTSLLVGPNGVSAIEAYRLITETISD